MAIQCTLTSLEKATAVGSGEAPEDWPKDLPHPEALSPASAKEADDVSELVGGYVAAASYSKTWQLREAGLNYLQAYLIKLVRCFMDLLTLLALLGMIQGSCIAKKIGLCHPH